MTVPHAHDAPHDHTPHEHAPHDHAPHEHAPHEDAPHDHDAPAARVGSRVITVADVVAREQVLRAGPFAARLPVARTPQGRNVLRWIVQLLATEHLVLDEARRRGLRAGCGRPPLDIGSAVALGGVVATVLASVPVAAAVRDAVTADLLVDDVDARDYHARNLDQFTVPESRLLDTVVDGRTQPWGRVVAGELPPDWEAAVFEAPVERPVTVGTGQVLVVREVRPARVRRFEEVRNEVLAMWGHHRRDLAFGAWLQERYAQEVVLEPGFEHPGDPEQADATHRH